MSETQAPEEAAVFCANLVRAHDFPRYASTLFLPSVYRRPLLALYAFNVEISRVRELVSQPLPGEIRLRWWTDMLLGNHHGDVEGNPVAAELLWAIRTWRLPIDRLVRLVEEHEFDLYNDPMPSLSALEGYANDTASALFACGSRFLLRPTPEVDHVARHAGLAYGMTEALLAMPTDTARHQLFLPLQLLEQSGSGQHEVFVGKQTPAMRIAIDRLVSEARQHLDTALELLSEIPADVRPAFLPLALTRRDLKRMARADYDPFLPRRTPRLRLLWTLWRASRSPEFRGET